MVMDCPAAKQRAVLHSINAQRREAVELRYDRKPHVGTYGL